MSNIFYLKKIKLRFQRELFFLLSGKRAIFQIFAYLFQISGEDFHIFFGETGPELDIYISQKMPEGLCLSSSFWVMPSSVCRVFKMRTCPWPKVSPMLAKSGCRT